MKNSKPKIAVTNPNSSGNMMWLFTALNVKLAGGEPVRVQPKTFDGRFTFDGVIIGGGADVHPKNTNVKKHYPPKRSFWLKLKEAILYPVEFFARLLGSGSYDLERDEMELKFIDHALNNQKPILGICRGHQLINSKLGGSLHENTLSFYKKDMRIRSIFPRKKVLYTKDNSLIDKIAGDDPIKVNALHSQAVAETGENLESTGVEKVGINQVIENKENDKVLGVQWHPEYLFYKKVHRNIFKWLITEAKNEN